MPSKRHDLEATKRLSAPPPTFAATLRTLRAARGLTQPQLSEAAGIHLQTLRNFEQGVYDDPRLSTLRKLAAALGVTVGELVG